MARKVFVEVLALHDKNGKVTPQVIIWENGHRYEIDRVLDVSQRAAMKAGGQGLRYTCRITGKETFLFMDEGKWFVEAK